MRELVHRTFVGCLSLVVFVSLVGAARSEDEDKGGHAKAHAKWNARGHEGKKEFDLTNDDHRSELVKGMMLGKYLEVEVVEEPNPMAWAWDLAIWTIVIFVLLLIILRKMAWGPMLEGLQKREESILAAAEEAKRAREETQRVTNEFKAKMDQAYAEIPKMMEEARRQAEAFKEETRAQTAKDVQNERQRLRREIETAKDQALHDLWNQAAQLATLMSAKVIGRSLPMEDHHRLIEEAMGELREAAAHR